MSLKGTTMADTDTEIESCLSEVDSFIADSRFLAGRETRMQSHIWGTGTGDLMMGKFGFILTEFDLTMLHDDAFEAVSATVDDAQLSALTCWLLKLMAIRADNALRSSINTMRGMD
jgi:hypothetical protein